MVSTVLTQSYYTTSMEVFLFLWSASIKNTNIIIHVHAISIIILKHLPCSGLFSWVEIFVKSWKRPPELIFCGFNFCGVIFNRLTPVMWTLNLGHLERVLPSTRIDGTLQCQVSQARPNQAPAWIAFWLLKISTLGVVGSGLLKAVRTGVWLPRLRERLLRTENSYYANVRW